MRMVMVVMMMMMMGRGFRRINIVDRCIGVGTDIWVVDIIATVSAAVVCSILTSSIVMMVCGVLIVLISSVVGFIIAWIIRYWCSLFILSLMILGR